MAAISWTGPSKGVVSDPQPALTLQNKKGGGLVSRSRGIAAFAFSPHTTALIGAARRESSLQPVVLRSKLQVHPAT
jgi:hypothetical protein